MTKRILVPVKRVVDPNVRVRVNSSGAVETTGLKMSLNPFDECALERALRLKEAGVATRVTVLTCGKPVAQDVLRTALAMGADDAVLIDAGDAAPDSLSIAQLLHAWLAGNACDLILCGKQAIDDDIGGVAAMLAGLLDWPQALNASALEADADGWLVTCGDDAGTAVWKLDGPAVISADLRLAEPRHVTLPNLMKAKQKPLATIAADTLGVAPESRFDVVRVSDPPARAAGIKVPDAAALIDALAGRNVFAHAGA
ncbi:electron transfer flavoprotein subunit beta/FixA family protein [Paraburkholderia caballeronis]|uniref:electron transfer flavoprotein subunit beta/FixA family protein n=1 Tax=Paraburkholderia caballeronis TaxID=416943 RepID=UPI001066F120|nr:electron transfer flavoprotein subunit beta/FixA family protein [Paraburkholderia caballeronis]TDV09183.1 electron transfer flavoprotein beta subunit [Paraburkholderia caballeronis]TDV12243.1 electron transfer flavoprotein beta subunit [Paraburkholderia caballeronis]TDV22716.1 electron transfer flavoprotein beta subunit [Paraburkholderia caballeronis]